MTEQDLIVAITGHRVLTDTKAVEAGIDQALDRITSAYPGRAIRVLSALAEGADRLAARCALARDGGMLTAVLPMDETDYRQDFASGESQREFSELLAVADEVVTMPSRSTRPESYEAAGLYGLDRADVVLAVWDGQPARGRGGTAEIVAAARARRLPLAWIDQAGVRFENWRRDDAAQ